MYITIQIPGVGFKEKSLVIQKDYQGIKFSNPSTNLVTSDWVRLDWPSDVDWNNFGRAHYGKVIVEQNDK